MAKYVLPDYTNQFPDTAGKWVLALQAFRGAMGAPAGAADIRQRQQGSNEAGQPIVGVGNVMEDMEPELLVC